MTHVLALCALVASAHAANAERVPVSDIEGENVDGAVLVVIRDAVTSAHERGVEVGSVAETRRVIGIAADSAIAGCDATSSTCQRENDRALAPSKPTDADDARTIASVVAGACGAVAVAAGIGA